MSAPSDYVFSRTYRGPVQGMVLDWSGTVADAYVIAPAVVFVEVFKRKGVETSMEEARGPMGLRKDLHIQKLTEVPEIRERWKSVHGSHPGEADVAAMFEDFLSRATLKGIVFVPLGQLLGATSEVGRSAIVPQEAPGREGWMACQVAL